MTETDTTRPSEEFSPFQFVVLVLSIFVLVAALLEALIPLSPGTRAILQYFDIGVCAVFLTDFFVRLATARSKVEFMKWGWIDFVSSIPMLPMFRWGRLVRVVRIIRMLRAFRSTKTITRYLFRNRARGAFATVALVSLTLAVFASVAVLNFERGADSNIKTPADALWWSITTITTVGYGDRYPVTVEGRLVAVFLMVAGVGLFGTFTAFVASYFLEQEQEEGHNETAELREEIRLLSEKLDRIELMLRQI